MRARAAAVSVATVLMFMGPGATFAQAADPLCPDAVRRAHAARAWSTASLRLPTVAKEAGTTEAAALASAPDRAVGVAGRAFDEVWRSLQSWPSAVTVISKADQVFEVHGRIPPGAPSKISRYFNLEQNASGISGHLRPDAYAAIYAASLPSRDRTEHGVLFFDAAGALIFGVYVPSEHGTEDPEILAAFEATKATLRTLPAACDPAPSSAAAAK
jgi:putative heme iron utilization protein